MRCSFIRCSGVGRTNLWYPSWYLSVSLVERARKTVRGSADDIGWLQQDQSLPPTEDGTARFLEILDAVRSANIIICISKFQCLNYATALNKRCNVCFVFFISCDHLIHCQKKWTQAAWFDGLSVGSRQVCCHFGCEFAFWQFSVLTLAFLLFAGLFSNHGPLYFVKTKSYFSKMGLACHIAKIHSEVLPYSNILCCLLLILFSSSNI